MDNEQADTGRDGRTHLARPNVSGANGDGKNFIFHVQLTPSRIDNLTRLIHTLLDVMNMHTYIYIYIYMSNSTSYSNIYGINS